MSVLGWRLRTVGAAAAAVACALLVLSPGCGDDDGEAADEGTTTSTSATTVASTTTTQDPEAEVEAAYLAYWEMAKRLLAAPDPDDPEIAKRAIGTALTTAIDGFTTMRAQGQAIRVGEGYSHDVLSIDVRGMAATVVDCNVDEAARIEVASGRVLTSATTTNLLTVELKSDAGQWLVASIQKTDAWEGARSCDL
jgi:hypothetical protein